MAGTGLKILFVNENSDLLMSDGCSRDKAYLNDTSRSETAGLAQRAEFAVERVF
jgi:hypothetical protein